MQKLYFKTKKQTKKKTANFPVPPNLPFLILLSVLTPHFIFYAADEINWRSGNVLGLYLYLRGASFESRPEHRLWKPSISQLFLVFLGKYRKKARSGITDTFQIFTNSLSSRRLKSDILTAS
jgi:hypothetical protein